MEARGGLPTTRLFRNRDGRFTDVTEETGAGVALRGQGCVAADLDDDGHTDLYVTGADRSTLLWNDGEEFSEADEDSAARVFGWHTGAAAGDLDGNGLPDLVVSGYVDEATRIPDTELGFPNTHAGRRDLLLLNEGDRRFREVGREAGLEVVRFGYGLGVVLSDFERDGDLDVHLANDSNPNRLYENVPWPGGVAADPAGLGFRFEERAAAAGVADPHAGMGVAVGDWDGDGRSDIFVSNSRGQGHALYRSNPPDANDPSFTDVRADAGSTSSARPAGAHPGRTSTTTRTSISCSSTATSRSRTSGGTPSGSRSSRTCLPKDGRAGSGRCAMRCRASAGSSRGAARRPTTTTTATSTSRSCRWGGRSSCSRTAAPSVGWRSRSRARRPAPR